MLDSCVCFQDGPLAAITSAFNVGNLLGMNESKCPMPLGAISLLNRIDIDSTIALFPYYGHQGYIGTFALFVSMETTLPPNWSSRCTVEFPSLAFVSSATTSRLQDDFRVIIPSHSPSSCLDLCVTKGMRVCLDVRQRTSSSRTPANYWLSLTYLGVDSMRPFH